MSRNGIENGTENGTEIIIDHTQWVDLWTSDDLSEREGAENASSFSSV